MASSTGVPDTKNALGYTSIYSSRSEIELPRGNLRSTRELQPCTAPVITTYVTAPTFASRRCLSGSPLVNATHTLRSLRSSSR